MWRKDVKRRMRNKNKFWITVLVLWGFSCNPNDDSAEKNNLPEKAFVYDYSNFLNTKEEDSLYRILSAINERKHIRLIYCSIDNFEQQEIEVLAKKLFMQLCSGQQVSDNCGLILLSRGTRGVKISLGSDLNKKITDSISADILNNKMIPLFKKDIFFDGLKAGVEEIYNIIKAHLPVNRHMASLIIE